MFNSKQRSRSPHQPKGKDPKLPLLSKHSSQQFAGGCIEVFCRIKPQNEPHALTYEENTRSVSYIDRENGDKTTQNKFTFSQLFKDKLQQQVIPSICDPILEDKRFGVLLFAYGVTNSGKTYTTIGTKQEPGILYYLLTRLQKPLKISAFQVYNQCYYTLDSQRKKLQELCFLPKFAFKNYHAKLVTQNNLNQILEQAVSHRMTNSTHSNPTSSRSHAVFKIQTYEGRIITVVDLAGSQKFFDGENSKDGCLINKSLLTLGRCIKTLNQQKQDLSGTIPFRESKLTKCLAQYFTTQHKLYMIVTVNPSEICLNQTRKVLEYSALAKQIKYLNEPKIFNTQNDQQSIKQQLQERRRRNNIQAYLQYEVHYQEYMKYMQRKIQYQKEQGFKKLQNIRMSAKRRQQQILRQNEPLALSEQQKQQLYELLMSEIKLQFVENQKKIVEQINLEQSKWNEFQNIIQQNRKRKENAIQKMNKDHQIKMTRLRQAVQIKKDKIEKLKQTKNDLENKLGKQNYKSPINKSSLDKSPNKTWAEKSFRQKFVDVCLSPFRAGKNVLEKGGSALKAGVGMIKDAADRVSPFKKKWMKY